MRIVYILPISFLIIIGSLHGQSTKSNLSVGGFLSAEYVSGNVNKSDFNSSTIGRDHSLNNEFSIGISPYFISNAANNDQYGFKLDFFYSRANLELYVIVDNERRLIEQKSTDQAYGGGFFYRKYFTDNKTVNFFLQAEIGFNYSTRKVETTIPHSNRSHFIAFTVGGRPGLVYNYSEKLNFIATAGIISYSYIIDKYNREEEWNESHNMDASLSLSSFQLGLEYQL